MQDRRSLFLSFRLIFNFEFFHRTHSLSSFRIQANLSSSLSQVPLSLSLVLIPKLFRLPATPIFLSNNLDSFRFQITLYDLGFSFMVWVGFDHFCNIDLLLIIFSDGLARAKASRPADADTASGICGGWVSHWLLDGFVRDYDAGVCRWCGCNHVDHCPQLALVQSPPTQLVGPKRSRKAPEASAAAAAL